MMVNNWALSIQLKRPVCSRNFKNFRPNGSHFGYSTDSAIFSGKFCTIFFCFQILESFSSMESAQSFHYFSRRLHVHPSSQSGNTLLINTRLLCSARFKFTMLWQLFSWPRNTESVLACDQFCFFLEDWMLLLLTVANRFFNAVCPTKVKWKEVNNVLCLLDVKTK